MQTTLVGLLILVGVLAIKSLDWLSGSLSSSKSGSNTPTICAFPLLVPHSPTQLQEDITHSIQKSFTFTLFSATKNLNSGLVILMRDRKCVSELTLEINLSPCGKAQKSPNTINICSEVRTYAQ